jgi:hypothetical protein
VLVVMAPMADFHHPMVPEVTHLDVAHVAEVTHLHVPHVAEVMQGSGGGGDRRQQGQSADGDDEELHRNSFLGVFLRRGAPPDRPRRL